ncbi:hypothetical protein LRY58_02920 [Candidatus Woesebacteria bacterium]|nr:hypothetical protein [Candidatus Woesebacteria bacterium]
MKLPVFVKVFFFFVVFMVIIPFMLITGITVIGPFFFATDSVLSIESLSSFRSVVRNIIAGPVFTVLLAALAGFLGVRKDFSNQTRSILFGVLLFFFFTFLLRSGIAYYAYISFGVPFSWDLLLIGWGMKTLLTMLGLAVGFFVARSVYNKE